MPAQYDVRALERALEQAEEADAETHKLLNNLGLGHSAAGRPRAALRAHRKEKQACKRLVAARNAPPARLVDLAIAYRRCGDAMLKVDALELGDGTTVTARVDIARRAHEQYERGLRTAVAAAEAGVVAAGVEVQAASAAMSQSALVVAMETKERSDYEKVASLGGRAAALAERLTDVQAGGRRARTSMVLSAAVNLAIGMSGLGDCVRAKTLFQAIAVRAKDSGDSLNWMRGLANLAEETGEESDWALCLEYVDEWVALAKEQCDEGEEGEALRKRGSVLFELHRYEEAHVALDRAALLGRDENAREEARRNLELVESELEDQRAAEASLEAAFATLATAAASGRSGDFVAEALARLAAGENSSKLRRFDGVLEHLGRYFVLVDEYGCTPSATGVEALRNCSAVTSMAEALGKKGRHGEAVEWSMKELALYKDDLAGQSQAWGNIGIYLDDDGKYEAAKEALNTSMELANKAGDAHLRKVAQDNLRIVIENQSEKETCGANNVVADEVESVMDDAVIVAVGNDAAPSVRDLRPDKALSRSMSADEHSIVIDSGGNGVEAMCDVENAGRRGSQHQDALTTSDDVSRHGNVGCAVGRHASTTGSRSAADRSCAGSRRFVDFVALFRKQCGRAFQQAGRPEVAPRSILLERLRPLSAKLVACEEGDIVVVDFSSTFLCDDEVPPLMRTLATLPAHEPQLLLDFHLNPLLTPSSVRWLSSVSSLSGPPRSLPAVLTLDLSGTGIDATCLTMLARALCPVGTLPHVKNLAVGKNSLGKEPEVAAEAVSRLLLQNSQLQSLDLSLNLLSRDFLTRLVDCLERNSGKRQMESSSSPPLSVMSLDLSLNNRCEPTALFEVSEVGHCRADAPANLVGRLVAAVPSLRSVDVRACGARDPVRKRLFELRDRLLKPRDGFLSGELEVDDSIDLLVVSPEVYDAVREGIVV